MPKGYSTLMMRSSAGARFTDPPHAKVPPVDSAMLRSLLASRSTLVNTSTMSEVPAAELIARDEVFGINSPAAATMGTTIRVILFPGHHKQSPHPRYQGCRIRQ